MIKVLHIEDEAEQRAMLEMLLIERGYEFVFAEDGEEGLKKVHDEKPDIILLDHFIPKIKGLDVCKLLKEDPETKHIPIIIVTACGSKYIEDQCTEAGADGCVTKPYEFAVLIFEIERVMKKNQ